MNDFNLVMALAVIFGVLAVLYFAAMLYRNELVYKARSMALDEVSKQCNQAIKKGPPWRDYHDQYDAYGDYESMFYDFKKWRVSSFYKGMTDDWPRI